MSASNGKRTLEQRVTELERVVRELLEAATKPRPKRRAPWYDALEAGTVLVRRPSGALVEFRGWVEVDAGRYARLFDTTAPNARERLVQRASIGTNYRPAEVEAQP